MIVNYNNYDKKGNRYAVFGKEVEGNLELFILKCSKKDTFNKNTAKHVYEKWLVKPNDFHPKGAFRIEVGRFGIYHPEVIYINLEGSAKYTLNSYCRRNFYKLTSVKNELNYSDIKLKEVDKKGNLKFLVKK